MFLNIRRYLLPLRGITRNGIASLTKWVPTLLKLLYATELIARLKILLELFFCIQVISAVYC